MPSTHVLLLTGSPGTGKTTVIRKVAERLVNKTLAGFYTQEIRSNRQRQGFRLITFTGHQAVIAHVDFPYSDRVGKYGVDIAAIEAMVEDVLTLDEAVDIYLVDEVGKMECLSPRFVAAMRALLDSQKSIVATVAQKGGGFMAEVKRRQDAQLWELTHANRDGLPERILAWLNS